MNAEVLIREAEAYARKYAGADETTRLNVLVGMLCANLRNACADPLEGLTQHERGVALIQAAIDYCSAERGADWSLVVDKLGEARAEADDVYATSSQDFAEDACERSSVFDSREVA